MFLGNSKIYPLRPIADSTVTCAHATYNGSNLIASTITIVYNGETLIKNVDYIIKTNNGGVNAGDYIVIFKGINNYDGEVTGTFTIDKAAGVVTTAPEAKNLTYSGTALNLVSAGSGTGTMMYKLGNNNWSSSIPTATNAGSYTIHYKTAENANYLESPVSSTIVTISKANSSYVAPSAKTLTYNTSEQTLLNAGSTNHGTIQYSSNNSTWSTTIPTGTNVGTYTTYWRIIGDSNHNDKDSASIKTTISAKTVSSPTITLSQDSYSYDGNVKLPSVTSVKDGSTVIPSSEYTVSYSNNTNAGTATVTITDKLGGNYTVNGNKTFTITKVNPTYTTPTGKTGLVYNGNNLNLLNAGSTNHGTILYSSNNSTWSTSIPLTKNAGDYTLYWRLVGDNNHNDIPSTSIAVSIAKANQNAPTATGATTTYGTTATATTSGGGGQGSIEWSNGNTLINAGSKTTKAKWTGNSNYNASSWSNEVTLKVNKASGSVSTIPVNNNYTYNGTARAVASAGSGTGTMYYRLGSSGNFSTTMPAMTDAGSNTLYYYAAESDNYNLSNTGSITVAILKADLSAPTATGATTTYPTTATATTSGGGGQGSIEWESVLSQASVGSHTTRARWTGNSNYNASPWSNTVTVEMDKATGSASVSGVSLTYNGNSRNLVSVSNNTGTMYYRVGTNGSWSTSIPTSTNSGSWTIYYYMDASSNYTARGSSSSPWGSVSSSIDKADTSATVSISNWTYGGTASNPLIMIDGDLNALTTCYYKIRTAADSTYTTTKPSNAGNYTIKVTVAETANYKGTNCTNTFTINKAAGKLTISSTTSQYTGSTITLVSVSNNTGTVHYRVGTNGSWTTTPPTAKNPGNWNIYYYMDETTNYYGKYSSSRPDSVPAAITSTHNNYELVDLGLPSGTKWASMNVGATAPEEYGNYYKWGLGSSTFDTSQTPYNLDSGNLPDSVDTARQVWGGSWHMPTKDQIKELVYIDNTTKTYTTLNGVYVLKLTSKHNSNYIYIPFAGIYWSDGTFHDSTYVAHIWSKTAEGTSNANTIKSTRLNSTTSTWSEDKDYGLSVRPVIG